MSAIVKFNRKFTSAQLSAAVGTSSIGGTDVADGTWYISKYDTSSSSTPVTLYVGAKNGGLGSAVLLKVAEVNASEITGERIVELINTYQATAGSTAVRKASRDGNDAVIDTTYLKRSGGQMSGNIDMNNRSIISADMQVIRGDDMDAVIVIGDEGEGAVETENVNIYSQSPIRRYEFDMFGETQEYTILDTSAQTLNSTQQTQVRTNIGATSSADVDTKIGTLDGTITKTAGSASASTAAASYQKVPVVSGFALKEVDGKLVETNAASGPSTVSTVDVDAAGSAQKALADAKDYADTLITGLGTILTFKGTQATEAALKALTNQKKGWVYIVTADNSEWVCTDDIGSTAVAANWEKFGTTDVQGALYKNTTGTFASGGLVYANGTNGATNTVGSYAPTTGLDLSNTDIVLGNVAVNGQTSFIDNITVSDVASVTVMGSTILQGPTKIDSMEGSGTFQTNTIQSLEGDGTGYDAIVISPAGDGGRITIGSDSITPILFAVNDAYVQDPNYQIHKILHAGEQTLTAAEKTQVRTNIGAQAAGSYKTTQSAVTPAAGTTDGAAGGQYVEQVTQDTNGVITVTRKKLPDFQGSGSVGTASSAADAWKTVVHDASLSASRALSGNTKTIPAATANNDGYMTSNQASNLNTAVLALTWEE